MPAGLLLWGWRKNVFGKEKTLFFSPQGKSPSGAIRVCFGDEFRAFGDNGSHACAGQNGRGCPCREPVGHGGQGRRSQGPAAQYFDCHSPRIVSFHYWRIGIGQERPYSHVGRDSAGLHGAGPAGGPSGESAARSTAAGCRLSSQIWSVSRGPDGYGNSRFRHGLASSPLRAEGDARAVVRTCD